jgi:hypothetical protein
MNTPLEKIVGNEREMMSSVTKEYGLELRNHKDPNAPLIFDTHEYLGREPSMRFVYSQIEKVAKRAGVPSYFADMACSDETNATDSLQRLQNWTDSFRHETPGNLMNTTALHVAVNPGHDSRIIEVNAHVGVYQHPADKRILYGKVESYRDGVLRPTCGALSHVLKRFLGTEKAEGHEDIDYIGTLAGMLEPYKQEMLERYNKGKDDDEKFSNAMKYLSEKNCDVQTEMAVDAVKHFNLKDPALVIGTLSLNRHKYPDGLLLKHVYLIKGQQVTDLSKNAI